ncbi:hypothetical protein PIB30_031682, partial [Stylosanthes scabra]|nr:hypothetical protein [Stylosanthes scabra]
KKVTHKKKASDLNFATHNTKPLSIVFLSFSSSLRKPPQTLRRRPLQPSNPSLTLTLSHSLFHYEFEHLMASKLQQLQSKACQATKFLTNHGTAYYKQLLEQNK